MFLFPLETSSLKGPIWKRVRQWSKWSQMRALDWCLRFDWRRFSSQDKVQSACWRWRQEQLAVSNFMNTSKACIWLPTSPFGPQAWEDVSYLFCSSTEIFIILNIGGYSLCSVSSFLLHERVNPSRAEALFLSRALVVVVVVEGSWVDFTDLKHDIESSKFRLCSWVNTLLQLYPHI